MSPPGCPTRRELADYALGKLPDERSDEIAQHAAACPSCQDTLVDCGNETDALVASLRQPAATDPYVEESGCREAMELVEAIGHDPSFTRQAEANEAAPDLPELKQLGQYRLLAKLGEGGMGAVYKALHTRLEKVVAVKVLPRERTTNPNAVARFEREMKAVGRLEHPNIVRAMDANEEDGTHYLVMEHVDGLDLTELVKRCGPLGIAEACELIRQAALGLQYAHQNGLVHRDIKPSNLMLSVEGWGARVERRGVKGEGSLPSPFGRGAGGEGNRPTVKILDLGLALLGADQPAGPEMTGTGIAMGTADYMAPEQAVDSHNVDIRADIYALGCTLFKLLTGQAPFSDQKSNLEKLMAHMKEPAPSIQLLRGDVPKALAALIARMLAKEPAERPSTPAEVAAALEPFSAAADLPALATLAQNPAEARRKSQASHGSTEELHSSALAGTEPYSPRPSAPGSAGGRAAEPAPLDIIVHPSPGEAGGSGQAAAKGPRSLWQKAKARASRHRSPVKIAIAAMFLGFGLMVALGIIITIRHPDGRETVVEVPEGSRVAMNGKRVDVTLPGRGKAPPLAVAPFDAKKAKEHQAAWAKHLGKPLEQANSIGMKLVLIPPGEFMMGSTEEEIARVLEEAKRVNDEVLIERIPGEGPRHRVRITRPFYLGMYEVTQAEYQRVMGVNPSSFSTQGKEAAKVAGLDTSRHPLEMVLWYEAKGFCEKLSAMPEEKAAGRVYQLPTEAQWEYACRSGTTTRCSFGDDPTQLDQYAWNKSNSAVRTHPVGEKRPNAWGLYDMHGNVWEWCRDRYGLNYYATSPVDDPVCLQHGVWRVIRGGSWCHDKPKLFRCAYRCSFPPDYRYYHNGFRVACNIPEPKAESEKPKAEEEKKEPRALTPLKIGPPVKVEPVKIEIKPDPIDIEPGQPISGSALVSRPAKLPGLRSWTVDTRGHRANIQDVEYSPDGRWLASAGVDGTIRVLDAQTEQLTRVLLGHAKPVAWIEWSPDGKCLASSSHDKTMRFWDVAAGRLLRTVELEDVTFDRLAWSPDGTMLAYSDLGHNEIGIWDVRKGQVAKTFGKSAGRYIVWSPDGTKLASAGAGKPIQIWDVASEKAISSIDLRMSWNACLSWSPDGRMLAIAVGGVMSLYDVASEKLLHTLRPRFPACDAKFSPDGTLVACTTFQGSDIEVFDVLSGKQVSHLSTARDYLHVTPPYFAWSPDGRKLAFGCHNGCLETRLYAKGGGRFKVALAGFIGFRSWSMGTPWWSPDSTEIAIRLDGVGRLRVFNLADMDAPRRSVQATVDQYAVAWSPDGSKVVAPGKLTTVWSRDLSKKVAEFDIDLGRMGSRFQWSREGKLLAAGNGAWYSFFPVPDVESQQLLKVSSPHTSTSIARSPDEKLLALGKDNGHLYFYDIASGKPISSSLAVHGDSVHLLAFSPDGRRLASAATDGTVSIVDPAGRQKVASRTLEHKVTALSFSPDGSLLACGTDEACYLLELKLGQVVQTLEGCADRLEFSPNGKTLLGVGIDGTRRRWDVDSGKLLADDQAHPTLCGKMQWSPDRRYVAAWSCGLALHLWRTADAEPMGAIGVLNDDILYVSPEGHCRTTLDDQKDLVYIALTDAGEQIILTPAEFSKKYSWKNEPAKVQAPVQAKAGEKAESGKLKAEGKASK